MRKATKGSFKSRPEQERFWERVNKTSSCWLWTASTNKNGYGKFRDARWAHVTAHRFSWILANGPIPEGLWVLHRCDVPGCVNPDHLFLGTARDNNLDMMKKGRGRWIPPRKLTEDDVRAIRKRIPNETLTAIAKDYGLHMTNISNIKRGITYVGVQ